MRKLKKSHFLLTLVALVITLLILTNLTNLKKAYIQLFNKNAILKHYNNNGKLDGEFITYLNGKIHVKALFKNGLRNGQDIEYYSNGQIKNERLFAMGKETGFENEYYEDGKLDYKANWKNNKRYGSEWHWFENGTVAIYDTFDIKSLFYYSKYDNKGMLKQILGNIISPNIYSKIAAADSTILLNDNGSYHDINDLYMSVATPPNLHSIVEIVINTTELKSFKITNNTILIKNCFSNIGTYNIELNSKLQDARGRIIRRDSLVFKIEKD